MRVHAWRFEHSVNALMVCCCSPGWGIGEGSMLPWMLIGHECCGYDMYTYMCVCVCCVYNLFFLYTFLTLQQVAAPDVCLVMLGNIL